MTTHLRNVFGAVVAITLALAVSAASARQYANAYRLTESDPAWATVAAGIVVGTVIMAFMFPVHNASRVGFWGLMFAAAAAWVVNAATPLGLVSYAPQLWRVLILLMVALPAPIAVWVLKAVVIDAPKVTESGRKLRSLSPESDRKRIRISRPPKAIGEQKPTKALVDSESKSAPIAAEELAKLYETLNTVRDRKGNMKAAAAVLGMTPPGVGYQLRRLYGHDPEAVKRYASIWVTRNIREKVE